MHGGTYTLRRCDLSICDTFAGQWVWLFVRTVRLHMPLRGHVLIPHIDTEAGGMRMQAPPPPTCPGTGDV